MGKGEGDGSTDGSPVSGPKSKREALLLEPCTLSLTTTTPVLSCPEEGIC